MPHYYTSTELIRKANRRVPIYAERVLEGNWRAAIGVLEDYQKTSQRGSKMVQEESLKGTRRVLVEH